MGLKIKVKVIEATTSLDLFLGNSCNVVRLALPSVGHSMKECTERLLG